MSLTNEQKANIIKEFGKVNRYRLTGSADRAAIRQY